MTLTFDAAYAIDLAHGKIGGNTKRAESSVSVQRMDAVTRLTMVRMYRKHLTYLAMNGTLCLSALAVTNYLVHSSSRSMITI